MAGSEFLGSFDKQM